MNILEFTNLTRKRFATCQKLMLGTKHKEYSRYDDKLHNFRTAGRVLNITSESALLGMMVKQFVSVLDIVHDLECNVIAGEEHTAEKITDCINYLVLLEALLVERRELSE